MDLNILIVEENIRPFKEGGKHSHSEVTEHAAVFQ